MQRGDHHSPTNGPALDSRQKYVCTILGVYIDFPIVGSVHTPPQSPKMLPAMPPPTPVSVGLSAGDHLGGRGPEHCVFWRVFWLGGAHNTVLLRVFGGAGPTTLCF